jgi:hypothetical protein
MAAEKIDIVVEGTDATVAAGELSESIYEVFGHSTEPVPVGPAGPEPGKKFDPATVAAVTGIVAVALQLPDIALKVMDFKDRLTKKPKIDALQKKIEALEAAHPGATIRVRKPDGTLMRITGVDPDTLIDLFSGRRR